jgi:tetratricopeptide (TPR) repeat protein
MHLMTSNAQIRPGSVRGALAVLLAGTFACASGGPQRPEQVVTHDENGLTISEDVRVGAGVRADFAEALRHIEQEDYARGIALLLEVTERAPWITAAHVDLAIAYRLSGDLESAEESLARALELSPRHPAAYNELGIVLRKSGRFAEARESYEKALEIFPRFHFARRNLAILCDLYLADVGCALEHYRLYLEAVPDDEGAAMWIADLQNRIGE